MAALWQHTSAFGICPVRVLLSVHAESAANAEEACTKNRSRPLPFATFSHDEVNGMTCELCGDAVTHPIGASRLEEQMATWLDEKRRENPLLKQFSELREEPQRPVESWCLFTGEPMGICSHCCTKRLFSWLLREAPELGDEFLTFFTFADERPVFEALLPIEEEEQALIT